MVDPFDLEGQVALIVGAAAGGLGGVAANALRAAGASIAAADLPDREADLIATIKAVDGSLHVVDVTSEASVDALLVDVLSHHARVDILVVAAGVMLRKEMTSTSLQEWQRILDVNLTGTWLLNRSLGRHMSANGYGRIINFSTVYAERVGPIPESAYYASKAAIVNVTRASAAELGSHGVTANCIAPGVFYPTRMTAPLADAPEQLAWFAERTLVKRLGKPEQDLVAPLMFLASPGSAYVTGQVLYVDGGWSAC